MNGSLRLNQRVALVTGAGSGIGLAIARRLAEEGASVVVNDVRADAATRAVDELPDGTSRHLAIAADVADQASVQRMHEEIADRFEGLDILVNNAGIQEGEPGEVERVKDVARRIMDEIAQDGRPTTRFDYVETLTVESWRRMIDVHLMGAIFNIRLAFKSMRERGGGSIVNISATGALLVAVGGPPHYIAAKAGLLGLTRAVAGDLGQFGIRVNAVCPGVIETHGTRQFGDAMVALLGGQNPLGRIGLPEEIAATVAFLASDEASYTTGQTIEVNGGAHG